MNMKRCIDCEIVYPATPEHWQRNAARPDGLHVYCKPCVQRRDLQRYKKPARIFQNKASGANYRARAIGAAGALTVQSLREQLKAQRGKCYWCGEFIGRNWHTEHVHDLTHSLDNTPSNVVCSCAECNNRKRDKPLYQWLSELAARGIYHELAPRYGVNAVAVRLPLPELAEVQPVHRRLERAA